MITRVGKACRHHGYYESAQSILFSRPMFCEKGRYGTFSLERDTAPIIVPKSIHVVAVLRIRRNRCLISDRLTDSARQNGKPSFLTQRMSIWPNDPAWFNPYVVILTFCHKTAQALPQSGSLKDQQRQIFEQYVQDVLKRHLNRTFSLVQTFSLLPSGWRNRCSNAA